jgi:hypothetical protein
MLYCGTPNGVLWNAGWAVVTWLRYGPSRFRFLTGAVNFAPVQNVQTGSEVSPLSILFSGCQGSSQGVKYLWLEADHLPPSSPKVDIEWSDTPAIAVCLLYVHTVNFTFI